MDKTKILVVEDEAIVALEIKTELKKLDCDVTDIVSTKKAVFASITLNKPDIIMMDINLGKNENGIDIVNEIQENQNIPILYLTAFSDDTTMKKAFSTNPLGYIVKPFKIQELKTHIELAKYKLNQTIQLNINKDYIPLGEEFYFDMAKKRLFFQDKFIKLGIKEQHLLSILVEANHAQVPFTNIVDAIWHGNEPSPSALRTLVYRLKGKLGDNIIQVTYGYGYNLKPLT